MNSLECKKKKRIHRGHLKGKKTTHGEQIISKDLNFLYGEANANQNETFILNYKIAVNKEFDK